MSCKFPTFLLAHDHPPLFCCFITAVLVAFFCSLTVAFHGHHLPAPVFDALLWTSVVTITSAFWFLPTLWRMSVSRFSRSGRKQMKQEDVATPIQQPQQEIERFIALQKGKQFIDIPYVVKGMDVSFSGILSYIEATAAEKFEKNECTPADLCFSLQEMMRTMCAERNGRLFATDDRYCVDNGAMIAYTGLLAFAHSIITPLEETTFTQRFRSDEVQAVWREKMTFIPNGNDE